MDASTHTSGILLGDHAASRTDLLLLPSTSLERTSSAVYYCAFNLIWSDKPCEECALKDWGGPLEVIAEEPEDENTASTAKGQERYMSVDSDNASTIILTGGHLTDDIERGSGSPRHSPPSDKEHTQIDHSSDDENGLDEDVSGGAYLNDDALRDVEDYIEGSSSGDEEDRSSGDEEGQSSSDLSDGTTVGCYLKEDNSEDSIDGEVQTKNNSAEARRRGRFELFRCQRSRGLLRQLIREHVMVCVLNQWHKTTIYLNDGALSSNFRCMSNDVWRPHRWSRIVSSYRGLF